MLRDVSRTSNGYARLIQGGLMGSVGLQRLGGGSNRTYQQFRNSFTCYCAKYHKKFLCKLSAWDEHEEVTSTAKSLSVYCVLQIILQNRRKKVKSIRFVISEYVILKRCCIVLPMKGVSKNLRSTLSVLCYTRKVFLRTPAKKVKYICKTYLQPWVYH